MIKINLLPHQSHAHLQSHANLRKPLAVGVGVVVLLLMVFWFEGTRVLDQRDLLRQEVMSKESHLQALVAKNRVDEELTKRQNLLVEYTRFLGSRSREKFLTVRILDQLSQSIDPLKVWLRALSIDGRKVQVEGSSLSYEQLEKFLGNLEATPMFEQLENMETQALPIQGTLIQQFTLQFTTRS